MGPARRITVAAGVLQDDQGRVLLATRPAGRSMAGLWEFPGGKVDPGETPVRAVVRELREELGLDVPESVPVPLTTVEHSYDEFDLTMHVLTCDSWQGTPRGLEGQEVRWVPLPDLPSYPMPEADAPVVDLLLGGFLAARG